jgi:hypothetical protein
MVLADAKEIDARFVGEHRLIDHISDELCMRQEATVGVVMSPKVSSPSSSCSIVRCLVCAGS